jgi:DNA-binding protein HU-alpha
MTKTQLIDALMKEVKVVDKTVDLSKKETKAILAGLTCLVEKTLKKGDDLPLSGLGKFKVQSRKARIGRNPQTGAEIKIAAKKVVKFTVAKNLKDTVLTKKASAKKK